MPPRIPEINPIPTLQFSLQIDLLKPVGLHTNRHQIGYRDLCDAGLRELLSICWDFALTELRTYRVADETHVRCETSAGIGESLEIRFARDAIVLVHPAGSGTVIAEERKGDPSGADRLRRAAMRRLSLPI